MRRPNERLSQRHFVYELRRAIDLGRAQETQRLVVDHPRAFRSAHVQHNLGARRRARIAMWMRTARSVRSIDG